MALEGVRNLTGRCYVLNRSGRFLFLEGVWKASFKCLEGVQKVPVYGSVWFDRTRNLEVTEIRSKEVDIMLIIDGLFA